MRNIKKYTLTIYIVCLIMITIIFSIVLGNILIVGVNAKSQESEIIKVYPISTGEYMYVAEYRIVDDLTFPSTYAHKISKSGDLFFIGEKVKVVYFSLYPFYRDEIYKLNTSNEIE